MVVLQPTQYAPDEAQSAQEYAFTQLQFQVDGMNVIDKIDLNERN